MKKLNILVLVLIASTFLMQCSRKNAGFTSKLYHNVTAWNNALYNGQVTLEEFEKGKYQAHTDNYDEILKVEPLLFKTEDATQNEDLFSVPSINKNPSTLGDNSEKTATGLDRTIEKVQKSIENHSIYLKGKEHNKMMGRSYLMLGKAYMYKGNNYDALTAFDYLNKKVEKAKEKNIGKSYMAEIQSELGNFYEAEVIFDSLQEKKLKKREKRIISQKYAQFLIDQKRDSLALIALEDAYTYNKKKKLRGRFRYIQAQLYEKLDSSALAKEYYEKSFKKKPSYEMEVQAQIAKANLFDVQEDSYKNEIKNLRKLSKKGTYKDYKGELIYAIGLIQLRSDSIQLAHSVIAEALQYPFHNPNNKGKAYLQLADAYFSKSDYLYAGAYYDSAYTTITNENERKRLEKITKNIKDISSKYYLIKKNDSILRIATMSKQEQINFFSNHIEKLKEKEAKEQAEKEEQEEMQSLFNDNAQGFSSTFTSKGNGFYFYNESLKQKGYQEFKQTFGNRPLADNWRTQKTGISIDEEKDKLLGIENAKNPKRFDIDYYLDVLPTPAKIDSLKLERDSTQLQLGIAYYDYFDDASISTKELLSLLQTPPKDKQNTLLAYYNLYKINKKIKPELAAQYKQKVLDEFPNSKYAEYILNPDSFNFFNQSSTEATSFYTETYRLFKEQQYQEVIDRSATALEKFPKDKLIAKFALLSALSQSKLGNEEEYKEAIERIIILFEKTEEAARASELLKLINQK